MKRQILTILILLTFFNSKAQNLFPEQFKDCHQSKFSFCLDCGDTKAQYNSDLNKYFKKALPDISTKLKGQVFVQVIVDSTGNQCVKSLQSKTNKSIKKLKLKDKINSMADWKPAISEGKGQSSSIVIEFTFSKGQIETKYKRFDSKNTSNMKSIGAVEIKKKGKFKNKLEPSSFKVFTTQNSIIPWDMSRAITIDKDNTVWYGTDNGIVKITGDKMELINQFNSPLRVTKYNTKKTNSIMTAIVDNQNNKWFTDGYNAYKFDEKKWSVYDSLNSKMRWTTKMYADNFNNVYFTTFKGLVVNDGQNWSVIDTSNTNLPSNRVMGVFKDSKSRLWIGTKKGNIRIDGQKVEDFKDTDTPLASSTLTKGYEDSNGNIWFALYEKFPQTKGLTKLNTDGTWEVISSENADIPRNDVLDFAIDERNNRIWLSLNRVGLSMFDGENWQTFTPENSLVPSTYIQNITLDKYGNLWCATHAGLLKVEMK